MRECQECDKGGQDNSNPTDCSYVSINPCASAVGMVCADNARELKVEIAVPASSPSSLR